MTAAVVVLALVLAACRPTPAPSVPFVPSETPAPTEALTPSPSPLPTHTPEPKIATVCLPEEPASLAWTDPSPATTAVLEAINGGSIDTNSYGYQPVIYTQLPSLSNGGLTRAEVAVAEGQPVVDAITGEIVALKRGVWLAQVQGDPVRYEGRSGPARTIQLSATWTLVDGLTWHDGQPVTAGDQVFMFETARSPDWPLLKGLTDRTAEFVALDERTTRWTGLPGFDDRTAFLNVWSPLPRHAYGHLTPEQMLTDESVTRRPLGYGPFRLVEWVLGESIRLEAARETYWRAGVGLPRVDTLLFRFVPDAERLVNMLASGECDLGPQSVPFADQLPLLRQLESEGRLTVHATPAPIIEVLSFNARPASGYPGPAGQLSNSNGSFLFADPAIRQALAFCLDRRAIVEGALGGAAVAQDAYVPANHPMFPPMADSLTRVPFDPAVGLELLASRGWTDHDGDGLLDRSGQTLSFVLSARQTPAREAAANALQAQWRQHCGIESSLRWHGAELLIADSTGVLFGRQFDVAELAWPVGPEPPCDLYLSEAIPGDESGWGAPNFVGYSNPEFDAACQAALAAFDPAEKAHWHGEAMRLFSTDLPALPLFTRLKIAATSASLQGFRLDPTAASDLWNVEEFDIIAAIHRRGGGPPIGRAQKRASPSGSPQP